MAAVGGTVFPCLPYIDKRHLDAELEPKDTPSTGKKHRAAFSKLAFARHALIQIHLIGTSMMLVISHVFIYIKSFGIVWPRCTAGIYTRGMVRHRTRQRIWELRVGRRSLASPYFVPFDNVLQALRPAART